MKKLLCLLACAASLSGGSTRMWLQGEASDFEKGRIQGLSLRSDGRLSLAPKVSELFDASSAYLWAVARDSKGNLYTGGGPGAKLFQIAPNGTHKQLAEFDALEIHAIAIDSQDRIYAATSPDGKIYRVDSSGKSAEFYNPKQKYIWGIVFGPQGDLFVATGDQGQIHRVDANGKGSVFFKTGETHARTLTIDAQGNLLAGTAPGGLIFRISAAGTGFVLYQMSKREITAIAAAPDGSIYAAGLAGGAPVAPTIPIQVAIGPAAQGAPVPEPPASRPITSGGANVYRIAADGTPDNVWNSARDTVYAIAFDKAGRAVLGAGNKGNLYRIDSRTLSTNLLSVTSTQITSIVAGADGAFYAATGNVGKLFRFGPDFEASGSIESDVFDSNGFTRWGRLKAEGTGKIDLLSRTGNVDRPGENWSGWVAVNERVASPPARFLQWKAVLSQGAELDSVEAAYLLKNVPPRVEEIDITPANYRFPAGTGPSPFNAPAASISLPAMGKKAPGGIGLSLDSGGTSMSFAKGWIGARWTAADDNGDTLSYSVEIRGEQEKLWRPLAEKLREKHYTFDSTAFPDGEYRLRITASDAPSNVEADALSTDAVSPPFLIDNTPPQISALTLVRQSKGLRATWKAVDALNTIDRMEYSLDGHDWTLVDPTGKLSDSKSLNYELDLQNPVSGGHVLAVRVTDEYANQSVSQVSVN